MSKNPYDVDGIPRRVMPLIFMVDTSGSMEGSKIESLNMAVREAIKQLGDISKNNSDAVIKVAVLEFSNDAKWMSPELQDAESFSWSDRNAGGMTSFGVALNELNNKLSRSHGFMGEPSGMRAPAIILLSDGQPTDEYRHALEKLKGNAWFGIACKLAIAIGDSETDRNVLKEFTGSVEAVITVHNVQQLKDIIRVVSVTSGMVGTQHSTLKSSDEGTSDMAAPQAQTISAIKNAVNSDQSLQGVDLGASTKNSGTDNWDSKFLN